MSDETAMQPMAFNGIDGATGSYLLPETSPTDISKIAQGEQLDPTHLEELKAWHERVTQAHLGVIEGVDPKKIEETGWGVIFAFKDQDKVPAIMEALTELLNLRKGQANKIKERYREYTGPKAYRPNESKPDFLARHGIGPGPANPDKVPYYLLIVGDPEAIPYRFQYQLDVQYAVGRIHFETLDEYAAYARSVVTAETGQVKLARKATFFGVQNSNDAATSMSAQHLVEPLAQQMTLPGWKVEACLREQAGKADLGRLLGGEQTPALLFTASHGMGFPNGHARQLPHQGALLCQDWPGPAQWKQAIPEDFYFSADDVTSDARLLGMISFLFACYGGGTPRLDDFAAQAFKQQTAIAPHAFVASLPRKLLSHPKGGALAVVGHVERAWGYSFMWEKAGKQLAVFQSALQRLMEGHPVGSALEFFNQRYAELSSDLSTALEDIKFGATPNDLALAGMWTANNDARSYAVIGDPAVRLPLADDGVAQAERPTIVAVTPRQPAAVAGAAAGTPGPASPDAPPPEAPPPASPPSSFGAPSPSDAFAAMLEETKERYEKRGEVRAATKEKIEAGKFLEADSAERVARRLERLNIDPGMAFAVSSGQASFATVAAGGPAEPSLLERVLGASDLMGVSYLELGLLISRTVGRIHCRNRTGQTVGYGTGFMVSPRLLMTNNHVLRDADIAASSQIEFNYQVGVDGKPTTSTFFNLAPDEFFLTDRGLDYSLVAVQAGGAPGASLDDFGWNRLSDEEGKIIKGECVNIIQHPAGEPKQLALRENRLEDVLEQWLHYQTDTAPGSSGSPLYNDQWEVVGLHHSGVPKRDEQGNILARDGQVWDASMGEHRIDWIANEGARISRIIAHIKEQSLSAAAARLRDQMFEGDPLAAMRLNSLRLTPQEHTSAATAAAPAAATAAPGEVTLTVPIQITVRLGQPSQGQPATVITTSAPAAPVTPPISVPAELRAALDELAKGKTRAYYYKEKDARERDAYYATLDLRLGAAELYGELSKLLRVTHAAQPPYKPVKMVYPWVDLHPDRMIRSIYSGMAYDPETFIREDFSVDEIRSQRTNELLARESSRDLEFLRGELDLLEAQLPYNCEHVVPQSWFGKKEPMRGDLHHLFACESGCNSFRGNHAYFDFADFQEVIRNDCGKRENNRFEPFSVKGKAAAARATLYFLLRYPGLIASAGGELDAARLPVLIDWHKGAAPDEYELHRNQVIFGIQGNRNPLIDFPDWADKIDFRLGFGA